MDWTNEHATSPPTVLVADPDCAARDLVRSTLEEIGLRVLEAGDASEARKCLHKEKVSLVLAEVILPHTSGEKLAAEIVRRGIPVVLMSGRPEGLKKAEQARRIAFGKPLHIKDLLRIAITVLPSWDMAL